MTKQESAAIAYLRCISVAFILVCHILQGLQNQWYTVFNIGVQIFFILSGFLYGKKYIKDVFNWYKNRMIRILIPFYIYLFFAISVVLLFSDQSIRPIQYIYYLFNIQGFDWGVISGLGHLWFLSWLMICYLLTPILQYFAEEKKKYAIYILLATLVMLGICCNTFFFWILLYVTSFFVSKYSIVSHKVFVGVVTLIAITTIMLFSWDRGLKYSILFHFIVALFIVILTMVLSKRLNHRSISNPLIRFIDNYSYEIYITHHLITLGYFSMLNLTASLPFNVLLIIVCTLLQAYVLKKVSNWIIRAINL